MCMVLTRLCLWQVGVDGRLHRRPMSSHLAAAATAAWRLIRVSFQAILLRGGRLTARSLHHSLYHWARSRSACAAAGTGLLSTLKLCCLLYTCCRVSAHALRCYMYFCCTLPLPTLSFRLPPQQDASIDALAHKRNQPSPTLADGLISRTDSLLFAAAGHAKQIPTAKA